MTPAKDKKQDDNQDAGNVGNPSTASNASAPPSSSSSSSPPPPLMPKTPAVAATRSSKTSTSTKEKKKTKKQGRNVAASIAKNKVGVTTVGQGSPQQQQQESVATPPTPNTSVSPVASHTRSAARRKKRRGGITPVPSSAARAPATNKGKSTNVSVTAKTGDKSPPVASRDRSHRKSNRKHSPRRKRASLVASRGNKDGTEQDQERQRQPPQQRRGDDSVDKQANGTTKSPSQSHDEAVKNASKKDGIDDAAAAAAAAAVDMNADSTSLDRHKNEGASSLGDIDKSDKKKRRRRSSGGGGDGAAGTATVVMNAGSTPLDRHKNEGASPHHNGDTDKSDKKKRRRLSPSSSKSPTITRKGQRNNNKTKSPQRKASRGGGGGSGIPREGGKKSPPSQRKGSRGDDGNGGGTPREGGKKSPPSLKKGERRRSSGGGDGGGGGAKTPTQPPREVWGMGAFTHAALVSSISSSSRQIQAEQRIHHSPSQQEQGKQKGKTLPMPKAAPQSSSSIQKQVEDPPKLQINVTVHRLRHLQYNPSSIVRLASTPSLSYHKQESGGAAAAAADYIALSRENGSVELKSPDEKFRTVAIVHGMKNRVVDSLVWTCGGGGGDGGGIANTNDDFIMKQNGIMGNEVMDANGVGTPRTGGDGGISSASYYSSSFHQTHCMIHARRTLFGASSRDGTIFIIDFRTGRHVGVVGSGGGAVLCLASLCGRKGCKHGAKKCPGLVAAGCEDGSVRIYRRSTASVFTNDSDDDDHATNKVEPPLELVSTLPPAGAPILSLEWIASEGRTSMAGSVLYAGVADGTIRRYECVASIDKSKISTSSAAPHSISTGAVLVNSTPAGPTSLYQWKSTVRMTLPSQSRMTPTRVWSLAALSGDGGTTLISGDSLGKVHIWDGQIGTLQQTFVQNESGADVLDVVVNGNETKIFASGIDSRVVCIERRRQHHPSRQTSSSAVRGMTAETAKWYLTHARRPHTHDVRSLALTTMRDPTGAFTPTRRSPIELLCSGGVDTKMCTYVTHDFSGGKFRPKIYYPWPGGVSEVVKLAREKRVLAILRDDRVDLYRLGESSDLTCDKGHPPVVVDEERTKLISIEIKSLFNLVCADISDDGKFLAVSDSAALMLFRLEYVMSEDWGLETGVVPSRVELPKEVRTPCTAVKFASDGSARLCCARVSGPITILSIEVEKVVNESGTSSEVSVEVQHTFKEHLQGPNVTRSFPITSLDTSPDGRWLVAGRNGVARGSINVFAMKCNCPEDTSREGDDVSPGGLIYRHWYSVPALEAPHSCIKFLGGGEVDAALVVGCTNLAFYIFDVTRRRLSDWSQDSGYPISQSLPRELTSRSDFPVRFAFNGATPNKFLLGSFGAFCAIDLDQPVPERSRIFPQTHVRGIRTVPRRPRSGSRVTDDEDSNAEDDGDAPLTKRKRKYSNSDKNGSSAGGDNFTICLRYNGMLFMDFVAENEMVIVEQPWLSVVSSLPDALERRVYGS